MLAFIVLCLFVYLFIYLFLLLLLLFFFTFVLRRARISTCGIVGSVSSTVMIACKPKKTVIMGVKKHYVYSMLKVYKYVSKYKRVRDVSKTLSERTRKKMDTIEFSPVLVHTLQKRI